MGCSSDGDTVIIGSGGELNNNDAFPASSIAANNLAPDGGGMSPNNGNVAGVRVIYCCDCCGSDGDSTGVSNDALILFTYTDTGGQIHLYATHFSGGSFTPPTRLRAPDRDETTGINTAAFSAVCLSTAGYQATVAADGAAVTRNAGAWVILGDYTTFFNDPRLATTAATTGLVGAHRALAQWVFLPELRNSGLTTSDRVGATARTFENGFMTTAIQLEAARTGAGPALGAIVANPPLVGDGTYVAAPAANVQSYGLVSDSFCGQTCYMGSGTPATPATGGNSDWVRAQPVSGAPGTSSFTLGEKTTHVGLFYTQIVSSLSGGGSFSQFGVGHGGADVNLTFHSLDMKTLTFEAGITMNPPAARNADTDTIQRPGTAWFPGMYGYNQYLFIKYLDMSLNQNVGNTNADRLSALPGGVGYSYDNTGGHNGGILHATAYYEEIIAGFCLVNDGDGTCSPGSFLGSTAGGADAGHDLSVTGSTAGGNHVATVAPTVVNSTLLNAPKREIANFNHSNGRFIFGADEGLGDTTIFWVASDNTNTGTVATAATGDDTNFHRALMASAFQASATGTAFVTNGEPRRLSSHQGTDFHTGSDPTPANASRSDLNDPVRGSAGNYFSACMNRTGTWVSVVWTQNLGLSTDFRQALNALVYQTFRPVAATTGGAAPTAGVDFGTRFTAPAEVSDQLPITLVTFPNGIQSRFAQANTAGVWNSLPVNAYAWQSKVSYRCGFQSNRNILNVAWEQSDATEDRVFVKAMTVTTTSGGTPSFTLSTAGEIDGTASVQGYRNFNNGSGLAATNVAGSTATFRWLNGEVNLGTNVRACDLGADSTGNAGGLFIVYSKVVDGTTSDNDLADRQIFATRFVNGSLDATPVAIGVDVDEQAALPQIGPNAGVSTGLLDVDDAVNGASGSKSTNNGGGYVTDDGLPNCALVCVPNNDNITSFPDYQGDAIYVYFYGPSATNGSGSRALYTRKFDATIRRNATLASATPNFGDRFNPTAGTGPGSTGFLAPRRLDHQDNQVTNVQCCQNGSTVLLGFMQDNHAWAQLTANGIDYLVTNGAPNPYLIDNDTSTDLVSYTFNCCPPDGDARAFIVTLTKLDSDNDTRLRLRAGSNF
ncbi:MAG: hypothetical protein KDD82_00065 [Planctomycetes bacterium]|nr:hypothetical protein [Planctomycetota bacterium]